MDEEEQGCAANHGVGRGGEAVRAAAAGAAAAGGGEVRSSTAGVERRLLLASEVPARGAVVPVPASAAACSWLRA